MSDTQAITKPRPFFTKENAREYARRANIARWSRPPAPPEPERIPDTLPDQTSKAVALRASELLLGQLDRLRKRPAIAPDRLDQMTRSIERLWEVYSQAAGIPKPGHLKPERKGKREHAMIDLQPEPLAVLPEPERIEGKESLSEPDPSPHPDPGTPRP